MPRTHPDSRPLRFRPQTHTGRRSAIVRTLAALTGAMLAAPELAAVSEQRVENIVADQWYANNNNALPRGAPDNWKYDSNGTWKGRAVPRVNDYNAIARGRQVNPWGQVYEVAGQDAWFPNTRVQLTELRLWELVVTDSGYTWYLTQRCDANGWGSGSSRVDPIIGAAFPNDYSNGAGNGSTSQADDDRDANGAPRVRVGRMAWKRWNGSRWVTDRGGYANTNYHYYPDRRRTVRNNNRGIFVTCRGRLVNMAPDAYDDRNAAQYTFNVGADQWTSGGDYVGDVMMGRFKKLRNGWVTVRAINLGGDDIRRWPPPRD